MSTFAYFQLVLPLRDRQLETKAMYRLFGWLGRSVTLLYTCIQAFEVSISCKVAEFIVAV